MLKRKFLLERVKEKLSHLPIEILSDCYINAHTPLKVRCKGCGLTRDISYANLRSAKIGCPVCADKVNSRRVTVEKLSKQVDLSIEILNFEHVKKPVLCRCKCCGFNWKTCYTNIKYYKSKCPRCAGTRLTLEQVKEKLSHLPIEILSDCYINAHTPLKVRCKNCKFKWEASYSSFMHHKSGCPNCAGCVRLTLESVKERVKVKILSSKYVNLNHPLLCECKKGHRWEATANNLIHNDSGCPKCRQTKQEAKVQELLELSGLEFKVSDRSVLNGKELDFYIPCAKLAIEINGEFWHSTAQERITKTYHLDKTLECEAQGIKLLQFWDFNELQLKWEICESMILNALNLTPNKLYARNCIVKEISSKEGKEFCDKNHIQGGKGASVYIALEHDSKIVSVMSFGKSRFNKQVEWELLRFCSLANYRVVGGASKLLKFFEQNYKPKSLISYADRRRSSALSNAYKTLGFKHLRDTEPNYFYFKAPDLKLFSRQTFQRYKLEKYFGKTYDSTLTEGQIMQNEGFLRLYDCGNLVYVKNYEVKDGTQTNA